MAFESPAPHLVDSPGGGAEFGYITADDVAECKAMPPSSSVGYDAASRALRPLPDLLLADAVASLKALAAKAQPEPVPAEVKKRVSKRRVSRIRKRSASRRLQPSRPPQTPPQPRKAGSELKLPPVSPSSSVILETSVGRTEDTEALVEGVGKFTATAAGRVYLLPTPEGTRGNAAKVWTDSVADVGRETDSEAESERKSASKSPYLWPCQSPSRRHPADDDPRDDAVDDTDLIPTYPTKLSEDQQAEAKWVLAWVAATRLPQGERRENLILEAMNQMLDETLPVAERLALGSARGESIPAKHLECAAFFRVAPSLRRARYIVGGHEGVAKLVGHELQGMVAVDSAAEGRLHTPPSYIAIFAGVRVLVQGVVPAVPSSCVYGSREVRMATPTALDDRPLVDDDHPLPRILKSDIEAAVAVRRMAGKLNLAGHWLERLHRRQFLFTPIDAQVLRGRDNRLYLLKTRRLLPPSQFSTDPQTASGYLVRRLRREAILERGAVSSDALSPFGTNRRDEHDAAALAVSEWVETEAVDRVVDDLIADLSSDELIQVKVALLLVGGLSVVLHRRGVNCRLLGRVLQQLGQRRSESALMAIQAVRIEIVARTLKVLWERAVRRVGVDNASPAVRHLLRGVLDCDPPKEVWDNVVWPAVTAKFGDVPPFTPHELQKQVAFYRISQLTGIVLVEFEGGQLQVLPSLPTDDSPLRDGLLLGVLSRLHVAPIPPAPYMAGEDETLWRVALTHIAKSRDDETWALSSSKALQYCKDVGKGGSREVLHLQNLSAFMKKRRARVAQRMRRHKGDDGLFRYVTAKGEPLHLDTAALKEWKLYHGMRVRINEDATGVAIAPGCHIRTTILGVAGGQVWRQDDGAEGASPFTGKDCIDIMDRYQYVWIGEATPTPTKHRLVASRFLFSNHDVQAVTRLGKSGILQQFDTGGECLRVHGFQAGAKLQYTKGSKRGLVTVVLGVFCGRLWVHDCGGSDLFPVPLPRTYAATQQVHGFRLLGHTVLESHPSGTVRVGELILRASFRAMYSIGVHHSHIIRMKDGSYQGEAVVLGLNHQGLHLLYKGKPVCLENVLSHKWLADFNVTVVGAAPLPVSLPSPPDTFLYPTTQREVIDFDISPHACEPFGLFHAQRYKVLEGRGYGEVGTVIGVAKGSIWGHPDEQRGAVRLDPSHVVPLGVPTSHTKVRSMEVPKTWKKLQGVMNLLPTKSRYRTFDEIHRECDLALAKATSRLGAESRSERTVDTFLLSVNESCLVHTSSKRFPCLTVMGEVLEMLIDFQTCDRFGYHFGQLLRIKGCNEVAAVVGVSRGVLWRQHRGEVAARPFKGRDAVELASNYQIEILGIADDLQPFSDPFHLPDSIICKTSYTYTVSREGIYPFHTVNGELVGFNIRDDVLAKFGFVHNELIQRKDHTRSQLVLVEDERGRGVRKCVTKVEGPVGTVIGVEGGKLWVQMQESVGAEPLGPGTWVKYEQAKRKDTKAIPVLVTDTPYQHPQRDALVCDGSIAVPAVDPIGGLWEYRVGEEWVLLERWEEVDRHFQSHNKNRVPVLLVEEKRLGTAEVRFREMKLHLSDEDFPLRRREVYGVLDFAKAYGFNAANPEKVEWLNTLNDKVLSAYLAKYGEKPPLWNGEIDGDINWTCSPDSKTNATMQIVLSGDDLPTLVAPILDKVKRAYTAFLDKQVQLLSISPADVKKREYRLLGYPESNREMAVAWMLQAHGCWNNPRDTLTARLKRWAALERYHKVILPLPNEAEFVGLMREGLRYQEQKEGLEREEIQGEEKILRMAFHNIQPRCLKDASSHAAVADSQLWQLQVMIEQRYEDEVCRLLREPMSLAATQSRCRSAMKLRGKAQMVVKGDIEALGTHAFEYVRESGELLCLDQRPSSEYGFQHGNLVEYGCGDLKGVRAVVLGVAKGRLWRYEDGKPAQPFKVSSADELERLYNPLLVAPSVPVNQHDPFVFLTWEGQRLLLDISHASVSQYKVRHGERYLCKKGWMAGEIVTIIGTHGGLLYWVSDWSGAVPFEAQPGDDVKETYGLEHLYTTTVLPYDTTKGVLCTTRLPDTEETPRRSSDQALIDRSEGTLQAFGVQHGQRIAIGAGGRQGEVTVVFGVRHRRLFVYTRGIAHAEALPGVGPLEVTELNALRPLDVIPPRDLIPLLRDVPLTATAEHNTFRYELSSGKIGVFNRDVAVLRPWGVQHADRVVFHDGPLCGKECVVIGIRQDLLWIDIGETGCAVPVNICHRPDRFQRDLRPEVIGKAVLYYNPLL